MYYLEIPYNLRMSFNKDDVIRKLIGCYEDDSSFRIDRRILTFYYKTRKEAENAKYKILKSNKKFKCKIFDEEKEI